VFNHCDVSHGRFRDVLEKGRASKYYDCFMIDGDFPDVTAGNYAYFADCKYMPKWNTNDAKTRRYLIDIALKYLETGFDGLRLDVADEISHEMWRQLRAEVKVRFPNALILGEVWHDNEQWLKGDQMDGIMNYKLQKILVDYFGLYPITAKRAAERMNGLLMQNTEQANAMALNFLDNHDTPRFLRFTGGNADKVLCALCAMVMFPGMPCVFYGTELPLDGDGDPDCRKTFDWSFANRSEVYADAFKRILALKSEGALCGGRTEISAENGLLKMVRTANGERLTAYFNTGGREKKLVSKGVTLFAFNYNADRISDNGAVVIKNKV
ncbi:MAG: alpha-glycosidase, partial [Clostridia bacterium]|nr:alpha-glycosidase [Clostridia bacterium]